jgi:predicted CXXCH cytochrome family protein
MFFIPSSSQWSVPGRRGAARFRVAGALFGIGSALWCGDAAAGVADTPHNLVGSGRSTVSGAVDSAAVCAFCHTPHGGDQSQPLWQRSLKDGGASFATYDSFGRPANKDVEETGSVSVSCMSCHDGVQALNVTVNVREVEIDIAGNASTAVANGFIPGIATRSPDVSLSHPVGIPYGVWGARLMNASLDAGPGGAGAQRLQPPDAAEQRRAGFREPENAIIDGVTVWWLDTGAAGRQRGDIHLYTRTVASDEDAPFIECASCHDAHVERPNFLRVDGGDGICLTCHAL